jgi:hypothetical protein
MRDISIETLQELFAEESSSVLLILLIIDHDSLPEPIRVVNNNVNVDYDSKTYIAFPFKISLPGETDENIGDVALEIDAVDQTIINTIRSLNSRPSASIIVIRAPSVGNIEKVLELNDFVLSNVSYTALTLRAKLGYQEQFLTQKATKDIFSKELFPGVY